MKKYTVRAFHDSLGDRPVLMTLSFQSLGKILLESEDGEKKYEWSADQLKIERGGASNQLYLFTHNTHPGWMLYVRDYEVIQELKRRHPHKKVPRKVVFDTGVSLALGFVGIIVASLFGLYLLKDPLVDIAVEAIPKSAEKKLGELVVNNLIGFKETKNFAKPTKELQEVLDPLVKVGRKRGL